MPANRSRPQESSASGHGDLADYLTELTSRLEAQLGDQLVAAWVIGSGALGDFDPLRSDVDVQAVSASRLDRARLQRLAGALSHDALPCPVRGLEFVLYAHDDLADPDGPAFQLNVNTGPGMNQHEGLDPRAEPRFWFTLDVAIARQQARSLAGPPPSEVLPFLSRSLIVGALSDALAWYRAYDDAQAVLAGCRAWAWTSDGTWRSKGEAATWARARLADPTAVDWALARRAHPEPHEPPPSAVAAFFDLVTSSLDNARNT